MPAFVSDKAAGVFQTLLPCGHGLEVLPSHQRRGPRCSDSLFLCQFAEAAGG